MKVAARAEIIVIPRRRRRWMAVALVVGVLAVLAPSVASGQPAPDFDWVQIGSDIDGEAQGDVSGFATSLSADGTRIAIGAPGNDDAGDRAGHVRVFELNGADWAQLGTDIEGEFAFERSGESVALSGDGNRVVIGSPLSNGGPGQVRVFEFDGHGWVQLGTDIEGAAGDRFGWDVAVNSDGNRIIASGSGVDSGIGSSIARVYGFSGGDWVQLGADFVGTTAERFAWSVAMSSDGSRIAFGAERNDDVGSNRGRIRVYDLDGTTWNQVGPAIIGKINGEEMSASIAMSASGTRIASAGRNIVRIYEFDGTTWNQLGTDIDQGRQVSMSADGARVAVGRWGPTEVYEFDGVDWSQLGVSTTEDRLAWSVTMSGDGSRIASGQPERAGSNGNRSGQVWVYEIDAAADSVLADREIVLLSNVGSGRYLDGDGSSRSWDVDTSPDARWDAGWRLGETENETWTLKNRRRIQFLDADGAGASWNVSQSVRLSADDEWDIVEQPDGTYLIRNVFYDRYLAQTSNSDKNVITVDETQLDDFARWTITTPD